MYYNNDNLSILQAVTKSTFNTPSPATHDLTSPPSPVAPLFDPNDSENNEYSYAIISTEEIDLASVKKEKAQTRRMKPMIGGEESTNSKDGDGTQEKDDTIAVKSKTRGARYYSCLFLFVVLAICFVIGVLSLLEDGDTKIHQTKDFVKTVLKNGQELQDMGKAQWDRSKSWIHQEKATLFTLHPHLAEQAQRWIEKCVDYSSRWMDKTAQSVVMYLDQYLFFGNAAWIMDGKTSV